MPALSEKGSPVTGEAASATGEGRSPDPVTEEEHPTFDTSVAHQARVYDYWLGGKDNYAADRKAGDAVYEAYPGIVAAVRAQREFLGRAVRYLVAEAGIRQFLDIGTGIPTPPNVHEVAQSLARECRVAYVDNDPVVLSHARALLSSDPAGATDYIDADFHDTGMILREAARTLDFSRPMAVMLLGILQVIPDSDDPWGVVDRLVAATVPGSYLAVAHPAADVATGQVTRAERRYNELAAAPVVLRTHAEVSRFFAGLELLEPGVVQVHQWRPDPAGPVSSDDLAIYGGLGRKP